MEEAEKQGIKKDLKDFESQNIVTLDENSLTEAEWALDAQDVLFLSRGQYLQ